MTGLIKVISLLLGIVLAAASALLTLAQWHPWDTTPPLAGILDCLAIAMLSVFVLSRGRSPAYVNFAIMLMVLALGRLWLTADMNMGRVLLSAAHIGGTCFYLRHRRPVLSSSQKALSVVLIIAVPVIVWMSSTQAQAVLYAVVLAAMAAAAWSSRFPRYLTGIGTLLYTVSDLSLLAGNGEGGMLPVLSAMLYLTLYLGLLLMVWGVVSTLGDHKRGVPTRRT